MSARPPRLARAIVRACAPPDERPWLVADLDELHATHCARDGRLRANWWYRGQALRSVIPLLARRIQTSLPGHAPMTDTEPAAERLPALLYFLRHAFRRLTREPAFTIAAALTLAIGVGGNVAVFAVVEAVILRPLPYPDADRLLILSHRDSRTGITKEFVPVPDYRDIATRNVSFDAIGTYSGASTTIFGDDEPYRARALVASDGAMSALGFRPTLGRSIEAGDLVQGAAPVAVLGYEYWRDHLKSDKGVIGRSIRVNQTTRTIVGVGAKEFRFRATQPAELILPMVLPPQGASRRNGFTFVVARLKAGKTITDAATDLTRIAQQLEREFPESNLAASFFPTSLRDVLVGNTKPALVLLLAAVAVVLLIACVNVANLLLARSLARRREMAIRMALGASRGRLAAQLMAESFALAALSAVVGLTFAFWGSKALVALVPKSVEAPGLSDVHINALVLAFALGITLLTTCVFGLIALFTVRLDSSASVLVGAGRMSASGSIRRIASGLVVAEVALAIVLLVGAGLILKTFGSLLSVDPGFRYDNVMTMTISIPADRYRDSTAREGFYRTAFAALHAVPGVEEVGQAAVIPLTGNNWTVPFERIEHPVAAGERAPEVGWQSASGTFFKALRIPLLSGRLFDERDRPGGPPVVIISEAIQRRYFPNENPIGKLLKAGPQKLEIVGVVGDIRRAGLRDDPRPDMYFPAELTPSLGTTLFIRSRRNVKQSLTAFQSALRSVEQKTVFIESTSLADVAAESVRTTKLILWLLGVFAIAAMGLAGVGIYGVMSYVVRQRTREIGTRMALGATRRDIIWLVMREGVVIAGIGAVIGLVIGKISTRVLSSVLFNVSPSDPATMAGSIGTLFVAILLACYAPARRAASVDPARTLVEQ